MANFVTDVVADAIETKVKRKDIPEGVASTGFQRATEFNKLVQWAQDIRGLVRPVVASTWGEWYLRETRQRLRKRAVGDSAQLVVAALGDSWTADRTRFSKPAANALLSAYGDAGPGWTGFNNASGTPNGNVDDGRVGVSYTGTWDHSVRYTAVSPDLGMCSSSAVGSRVTVTGPSACSVVNLYHSGGASQLQYRWNAGAWTPLTLTGAASIVTALSGVPAGTWTLDLEVVSGTVVLFGLDIQKTSDGVRFHKVATSGSYAGHWAAVNDASWRLSLSALAPHLVTLMLGTNDQAVYDAATYKVHVQTLITRVRTALPLADILLIAPCENPAGRARSMADYAAALLELALANKCAFLNLQAVFGESPTEYNSSSARPWFDSDNLHPNPTTGGRAMVDAFLRLVTEVSPVPSTFSLPGSSSNAMARPTVGVTQVAGEVRGANVSSASGDDGFMRLSAGGGTNATTKSYIDLSGYSSVTDMDRNIVLGTDGVERARLDAKGLKVVGRTAASYAVLAYVPSMTPNAAAGNTLVIHANDGTAFTINAPTNAMTGQSLTFRVRNNTASATLGAVTWNAIFKMAAWTSPAAGFSRSITFVYDGTNWFEVGRTPADVPN